MITEREGLLGKRNVLALETRLRGRGGSVTPERNYREYVDREDPEAKDEEAEAVAKSESLGQER